MAHCRRPRGNLGSFPRHRQLERKVARTATKSNRLAPWDGMRTRPALRWVGRVGVSKFYSRFLHHQALALLRAQLPFNQFFGPNSGPNGRQTGHNSTLRDVTQATEYPNKSGHIGTG
jgi:hypothetical protein